MPRLPVRQNHHPRPQLPQHAHNLDAILERILDRAVGQVERLPPDNSENSSSLAGFAGPVFRRAPRAGLALGEVENPSPQPARGHT